MTTQTYRQASWLLLEQAERELAAGDTRQASEKGWGAAAQMVKAIAEQRGWPHQRHGALYRAVKNIAEETGDDEVRNLFHVANALHTNFYENWDEPENVRGALGDVQRFVEKLAPLVA